MNSSDYEPDRHVDISSGSVRTDDLSSNRTDNISSTRTDNLTSTRTDNLNSTRTDNLTATRTDNLNSTRTDNLTATRTDDLNENIVSGKDRSKNENLTWDEEDKHIESGYKEVAAQDLISKEREIAQFSIYGWISRKYAKELFLLVY